MSVHHDAIVALAASGLLARRIGERIGRQAKRVRDYARRHGISLARHPYYDRRVDLTELRRLAEQHKTAREIGELMGFGREAISRAARDNGIALPHDRGGSGPADHWRENDAALEAMLDAGKTFAEIATALGVTKNAVAGRLYRLGLTRPRKTPPRPIAEFPPLGRCVYPIGDPGTPDFHFCGDRAESGGPYCQHHHAIA